MPADRPQPRGERQGWRFFPSSMPRRERRIYGAVAAVFGLAFLASLWPVYPLFSRIRPLVLGVPFSLAYLVLLLLACFFSLLALYRWEARHGRLTDDDGAGHAHLSAREFAGEEGKGEPVRPPVGDEAAGGDRSGERDG